MWIFILFAFCVGSLGNQVPKQALVLVCNYTAKVDSYTSLNKDVVSRWTVSAILTQSNHTGDGIITQLRDIKTGIYNGPKDKFKEVYQVFPEEAKILEQPFIITYNFDDAYRLHVKKNEPKWSINMKKGLLNLLNAEFESPRRLSNGTLKFATASEFTYLRTTLYGDCYVTYSRTSEAPDSYVYVYTLDSSNCTKIPIQIFTNTIDTSAVRDKLNFKYTKTLFIKKTDKFFGVVTLVAKTFISYKSCPSCPYTQEIDQEQTLTFVNQYVTDEMPDVSEYTETHNPVFDVEIRDFYSGRSEPERNATVIAQNFIGMYYHYQTNTLSFSPPEIYNISKKDYSTEMYSLLMNTDMKGLKEIEKTLLHFKDDKDLQLFFITLLSYVGTNTTTEYLIKYLQKNNIDQSFASRIMMTFPRYLYRYSEEMLLEFEALTKAKHILENKALHRAALFGFSTAVGLACKKNDISEKYKQKYIDIFNQQYLDNETYERRMNNLLALVNIGDCLDFDFMTGIVTNSSESQHLRMLAFIGFKPYLKKTNTEKLFSTYWPLVQKKSEPFEIRISALDILLNDDVHSDQFSTIADKYSGDLNDPDDKQIANYILTHLHSGKLALYEDLSDIKDFNFQRFPKSFATGMYNLQYQDREANVGSYLQSRIITDPENNILDSIQFKFNTFAMGYDFGTYSIYFKLHGVSNKIFIEKLLQDEAPTLPELMKLLKEYNSDVKPITFDNHIDIVVFVDNIAVYAYNSNDFKFESMKSLGVELKDMVNALKNLQYPIVNYLQMPSDLGTLITVTTSIQNVAKYNDEHQFRNSWHHGIWMELYNPILDTHIANFKYDNVELYAHLNVTIESERLEKFTWYNTKDGLAMTWASNLGTAVNQAVCRECDPFYEAPMPIVKKTKLAGFDSVVQSWNDGLYNKYTDVVQDFLKNNKHLINSGDNPIIYPLLFIANTLQYNFWLENNIASGSLTAAPTNIDEDLTKSTIMFSIGGNNRNGFDLSQFVDILAFFHVENLKGETLSMFNMSANIFWSPNYTEDKMAQTHVYRMVDFYLNYKEVDNSTYFKVCGYGERLFPNITSDRLRLESYEPVSSELVFLLLNNTDLAETSCNGDDSNPVSTFKIREVYSPIDKQLILQDEQSLQDYKQCVKDSNDLKFTAPTKECNRISKQLTEYGNYKMYLEMINHSAGKNETFFKTEQPIFEYSRNGTDTLDVKIYLGKIDEDNVYKKSVYYPAPVSNPLRMAYNMDDSAIPQHARSTCTITPSKIQQFSGKFTTNERQKWLAFAKCFNTTTRGLLGQTIDEKHVEFTYYTNNKIVKGTVVNGKVQVTLNGQPVTKFLYTNDLKLQIHFLDDDVIYVLDANAKVEFYYNTEYITVRIYTLYSNLLCGDCI